MVTVEGHKKLCRLVNACRQGADNTTPMSLVQEMIDKIPEEIWKDTSATILDPAAGTGTFLVAAYWKMIQAGDTHENIISNRLFACEINLVYLKIIKDKLDIKNIYDKDFLQLDLDMKFDVVIANPPYSKRSNSKRGTPIYQHFVQKSYKLLKDNGHLTFIHPSGWRWNQKTTAFVFNMLKENSTLFLRLTSTKHGQEWFGVGTTCDYYIMKKSLSSGKTKILDSEDNVSFKSLSSYTYMIPDVLDSKIERILASDKETLNILYNTSYHTQREYMSKEKKPNFSFPVISSISKVNGPNIYWSSTNEKGHFKIPKIILTNGAGAYPILDLEGKYATTEFGFSILDTEENLNKIYETLIREDFIDLCQKLGAGNNKYAKHILESLNRDFWKEFI